MNNLADLHHRFKICCKKVESSMPQEKNLLIEEFDINVDWLLQKIQEERLNRNFLDDELALKIAKRGEEEWYDLPKGTDVFFAVPYEEIQALSGAVKFIFDEFISLVETNRFMPSRIVHLLQQLIEETNGKLKPLKLILSR